MRILKNIIAIVIIAALCIGVFIYAFNSKSDSAITTDSVILNEFMASNKSCLPDQTGEYSDWIEIYNPTDRAIDLSSLGLSNDKTEVKWAFPSVMLSPKGYIIVFASGKGISNSGAEYQHTNFKLSASNGGIYLTNSAGQMVDQVEYKDQTKNVSTGRDINDMSKWVQFVNPTPGFSNDEAGNVAYQESRIVEDAELLITEVMPSNQTTMPDNNGNYNDYIEIYNAGDESINLEGFGLSDDEENILKWKFPDVIIEPGAYLLVFASGEDTASTDLSVNAIHTDFRISAYQETVILSDCFGRILDQVTVKEINTDNAYSQIFENGSYIDEWEQTALPTPGYKNDNDGYTQFQENNQVALGNIVISEVMVTNSQYLQEEDGEHYDWIELYNGGSELIDITGYCLTDDASNPAKWRFPETKVNPGEYVTVMASGLAYNEDVKKKYLHTNFKLSTDGEVLVLFDTDGNMQDRFNIQNLPSNVSIGRMQGETALFYFEEPTPNTVNIEPKKAIVSIPQSNVLSGSYSGAQEISLTCDTQDAEMYYSLNGTVPTRNSTLYTGTIAVSKTSIIRTKAFKDGYIDSAVSSGTYIIGAQHSQPLLSIVTDPDNLFDPINGIYELGPNPQLIAGSEMHYEVANYLERGQESERPASFEVFDESGQQVFEQDVAIRIQGGFSRDSSQKSFAIFARSEYGPGTMEYSFFDNRPFTEYQSIQLRQGGQDQNIAKIKEIVALSLVEGQGFNFLTQAYKPYVLYLNGEYWGVYFMMEKRNEDFIAQHEGVEDPDNMNIMKATSILMQGSREGYLELLKYTQSHDMSKEENYDYLAARIDADSFMDEMISEIWVANSDYPNMQFYQILPDGKWKQVYYDFCWTFGSSAYPNGSHPTVKRRMDDDVCGSTVFNGLLAYKPWRDKFIERFAWALKDVYNPQRVNAAINDAADTVRDEMPAEREKFGSSVTGWEKNVEKMHDFANNRGQVIVQHLKTAFSLSEAQIKMLDDAVNYDG